MGCSTFTAAPVIDRASPAPTQAIQLQQRYAVACERLYDAWLTPRTLGMWMFDPATVGGELLGLDIDPRVGGAMVLRIRRGERTHAQHAVFDRLERPHRIVMRWSEDAPPQASSAQVVLAFTAQAPQVCTLTVTQTVAPPSDDRQARVRVGWQGYLDGLLALFAAPREAG